MKPTSIRKYIGIGLGLAALTYILYAFSDLVTWIVLAWIISLLGSPVMDFLAKIKIGKRRMGTTLRAAITMLFFVSGIGLFVAMFVPLIVQQGGNLASVNYAAAIEGLEEPINNLYGRLADWGLVETIPGVKKDSLPTAIPEKDTIVANVPDSLNNLSIEIPKPSTVSTTTTIVIDSLILASGDTITRTNIQLEVKIDPNSFQEEKEKESVVIDSTAIVKASDTPVERIQKKIFTFINPSTIISRAFSSIIGLIGNLFVLITSVAFIAFFFLQEEDLFARLLKAPFTEKTGLKIDKTLYLIKKVLIGYFEGILGQVIALTLYLWLLLTLVGAENAFLIAFFGGLINIIPYLGIFMGMAFGLIVGICSNLDMDFYSHTVPLLIRIVLVFLSMYALDNFLIQPYIFSKRVRAHPLEVFIVIVVGGRLGGIAGMVLAIPAYTVIRVIASVFLHEFKVIQNLTQKLDLKPTWTEGMKRGTVAETDRQSNNTDPMAEKWKE